VIMRYSKAKNKSCCSNMDTEESVREKGDEL
jgi:hypothetical protein